VKPSRHPTRLCLVTPAGLQLDAFVPRLVPALVAGDVASLIITPEAAAPAARQRIAEVLVEAAQANEVAAIVHNDLRIANRVGADGIHIDSGLADLQSAMDSLQGRRIVGAGGIGSRDEAMRLGEAEPDYLFFGRLDGDAAPGIFPKALELASWWCELFEIPAIVMGGSSLDSVRDAAAAGVEFVALRNAVWQHPQGPAEAVAEANRLLSDAAGVTA
jgi:thiamine-phosphate pyrophosphorylase